MLVADIAKTAPMLPSRHPSRWPRSPSPANVPGDSRTFCVASKIAITPFNTSVPPVKSG